MRGDVRFKLSVMMFIQYFLWGTWFVTLGTLLGGLKFDGSAIGWCYAAFPLAGMLSPFFIGVVADRLFATERILCVLHLLGAGLIYAASQVAQASNPQPVMMFGILLAYALCYMPTLALTNSISLRQMTRPEAEFPGIRVLGTIGWIVAGTLIGKLRLLPEGGWTLDLLGKMGAEGSIEATAYPMMIAAVSSLVMGIFCLFLPHTPPQAKGSASAGDILGLDALKLMREPSFTVFVIGSFLICIPLQFYYSFTNQFLNAVHLPSPAFSMTFGQWSEIFFMLVMPLFFLRLGVKWMLLFGMLAWTVRYVMFSMGAGEQSWMLYIGIVLHGICYDFFFVTGQISVDQKAPNHLRGAAQGFIAFVTLGAGGFIGSVLSGRTLDMFKVSENNYQWDKFWLVPAAFALVVMVIFGLLFREKVMATEDYPQPATESLTEVV